MGVSFSVVGAVVIGGALLALMYLLRLGHKSNGAELFMDFLRLTPNLTGTFELVWDGKSYHAGNGAPPYRPIVMRVHDGRFFAHVITFRNLGMGEAWMQGWFTLDPGTPEKPNADLYGLLTFFFINQVDLMRQRKIPFRLALRTLGTWLLYKFRGHKRCIDVHYNENREMYRDMLGKTEAYTCGFVTGENSAIPDDWRTSMKPFEPVELKAGAKPTTLAEIENAFAPHSKDGTLERSEYIIHPFDLCIDLKLDIDGIQYAKFERVCKKLRLRKGQRILDIGCGYGGFSIYAAKTYGVHSTAFAITQQMIDGAKVAAKEQGVDHLTEFHLSDLSILKRLPDNNFDAVIAIGVFEHVHEYEYKMVFDRIKAILKHDGMLMLHMMCSTQKPNFRDPWIQTYLFPNSHQNVVSDLTHEIDKRNMRIWDMEDIGHHYTYTLHCWWTNLKKHFDKYPGRYTSEYMKMMEYYLLGCKAMSAHGTGSLQQILVCRNPRGMHRGIHRYS